MRLLLVLLIICKQCNQIVNWENRFLSLGEAVANTFNLSSCWVCGSPGGYEDWPWIAHPVSPKWWISNRSDVRDGTGFWTEDSDPWRLHFSGKGLYCLNRTQEHGIQVGKSVCEWTLSLGFDCWTPNCPPYDCYRYRDRWNQTHVKLTNGSWVRCSYHNYKQDFEGCKAVGQDGFFDYLFLSCPRDNSTSKTHIVREYQWKWQHQDGTRAYFTRFWSKSNHISGGCNCKWLSSVGAWRCEYCNQDADLVAGGPLGPGKTLYYDPPIDEETWDGPFANGTWALKGHYWICGQHAYRRLPPNWSGICYVGYIRPLFFLLSQDQGKGLGVKVYDDLIGGEQSIDTSLTKGKWGKDEWPPERTIKHYGPAAWNPSKISAGAREPIYNLNHVIRLQAVIEIITNQKATALDLLADQSTQMRNAIFQHRMVLDYLLAEEGGVCGKLNKSNCCLQIDDNGKVVKQITKEMRKLAHVPIQTWKGWDLDMSSWLPGGPWIKCGLFFLLCAATGLMFIPCLIPCGARLIKCAIARTVRGMQLTTMPEENSCY